MWKLYAIGKHNVVRGLETLVEPFENYSEKQYS